MSEHNFSQKSPCLCTACETRFPVKGASVVCLALHFLLSGKNARLVRGVYEAANYPTRRWHPANKGTDDVMPVLYRPRGAAASSAPPASEAPANAEGSFDPALYPSLVAASPPPTALYQPRGHVVPPSSPSGVYEAVYEAANYPTQRSVDASPLDELAASSSADDTALTAPALPRRRPSILYAPRGLLIAIDGLPHQL